MALYHVFNLVDNRRTGVPMAGVQVRVKFDGTDNLAPIYADQAGTEFDPANYCITDADGMYSFYVSPGEYKLEFLVGSVVIKTISDFRPAEVGPTGPANSTYATVVDLESADVGNVSAILAEAGKSGTFTIRQYVDFASQVAADTAKLNYIRSTADTSKVWVRNVILSVNITASEAIAAGDFVNIYSSGGNLRVRKASAADVTKFANAFAPDAIANGAAGNVSFTGLNSSVVAGSPVSEVWLSDVVPGGVLSSPPSSSGSIVQSLGPAVPGLGVFFTFRERVLL